MERLPFARPRVSPHAQPAPLEKPLTPAQALHVDEMPEEFAARLRVSVPGYRLLRVIGRGGQATVYQAVEISTGRPVAIKVLHDGPFATEAARTRLRKEIVTLKALDHPNIVRTLDEGHTKSGHDFLVMNFIEGEAFDAYAERLGSARDPAGRRNLLELFARICAVVGHA